MGGTVRHQDSLGLPGGVRGTDSAQGEGRCLEAADSLEAGPEDSLVVHLPLEWGWAQWGEQSSLCRRMTGAVPQIEVAAVSWKRPRRVCHYREEGATWPRVSLVSWLFIVASAT